jgi:hypothetical protein
MKGGSRRRRDCGAEGPGRPRRGREADVGGLFAK